MGGEGYKAAQCSEEKGKRQGKKGVHGVEEGDADETGVEVARTAGLSTFVRLKKSGKSVQGKPARTSWSTSRQGLWTSTRSTRGPITSAPSQGATLVMNSPGGGPRKHCTIA